MDTVNTVKEANKEGIGGQYKHKNTGKREELEFVGRRMEILQRSCEITAESIILCGRNEYSSHTIL